MLKNHKIVAYISIGISVDRGRYYLRTVQELLRVILMVNYYFKVSPQYLKSFQTCLPKKKPKLNSEEKEKSLLVLYFFKSQTISPLLDYSYTF